jgi:hypothetical protein
VHSNFKLNYFTDYFLDKLLKNYIYPNLQDFSGLLDNYLYDFLYLLNKLDLLELNDELLGIQGHLSQEVY